jgi:hypothetical protein
MTSPFLKDANGLPCLNKSDLRCSGDFGSMDPTKESQIKSLSLSDFESSLTPAEKIVHDLAKRMLKTRYNPVQCNLFRKKSSK